MNAEAYLQRVSMNIGMMVQIVVVHPQCRILDPVSHRIVPAPAHQRVSAKAQHSQWTQTTTLRMRRMSPFLWMSASIMVKWTEYTLSTKTTEWKSNTSRMALNAEHRNSFR